MIPGVSSLVFATAAVLAFAVGVGAGTARAAARETWEVQGKTYADVRVGEVTGGSVTILHRAGITQLELATLPPDLQARFGFDADKAQDWSTDAEAGLALSAETRRRTAALRDAAGREAARAHPRSPTTPDVSGPVTVRRTVDLRPLYATNGLYLKNQGRRPSCSVFAIVSALEYELARHRGRAEPLSEEFLIWAARDLQPGIAIDDGFHFAEVLSALQRYGIPRLSTMPNTFGKKVEEIVPSAAALSEAPLLRGVVPVWIRPNDPKVLERVIARLNAETPVVIGLRWPHWRTLETMALLSEQEPLPGAGHAVTLIGYQCPDGNPENVTFLFRNSWGGRWGTGGCGHVTARYLRDQIICAFYLTLPGEPAPVNVASTP